MSLIGALLARPGLGEVRRVLLGVLRESIGRSLGAFPTSMAFHDDDFAIVKTKAPVEAALADTR